jgi:hypothetical protein
LYFIDDQFFGKKPPGRQALPPGYRPEAAASTAFRNFATDNDNTQI